MTARPGSRRRRLGGALILTGLLCGSGALAAFQATPASAVALFSFDLRAGARGFNYYTDSPDAGTADLNNPGAAVADTRATLQSGPVGYGLSTVAWPGALAANGGTLLLVLNPSIPPDAANQANDPVRAEARTGQNPPETKYTGVPGTELVSSATAEKVTADAKIASAAGVPGTFGSTTAHSDVTSTDAGGGAASSSLVQDINLGGVIKIESIRSSATAKTDGTKGDGSAATVVNGMTIGGQPAYVDDKGLHIGTQGSDTNAVANQIAAQALGQAGFKIYVSTPQKEVDGASATVTAGSLIISHPGPSGLGTIVFGGATAQVTGAPGDPSLLSDVTGDGGSVTGGGTDSVGSGSLSDVGSVSPSAPSTGTKAGTGNGDVALGGLENASTNGKPIRPATVLLGTLAAFFLAAGMRRLSDDVLAERAAATTCSLEVD